MPPRRPSLCTPWNSTRCGAPVSQSFFAPAWRLYERHGFSPRGPFADVDDPHSGFYERVL